MRFLGNLSFGKITVGRVLIFSLLGIFAFYSISFVLHVKRDLNGIGVGKALSAYKHTFFTSLKSPSIIDQPYIDAVSRALFLPTDELETASLWMGGYNPISRKMAPVCTKRHISDGAQYKLSEYGEKYSGWKSECFISFGGHTVCGANKFFRRPTCRKLSIHESIWNDPALRGKIVSALFDPCNYLEGEAYIQKRFNLSIKEFFEQRSKNVLDGNLKSTVESLLRKRLWAGCTGQLPAASEVIVEVVGPETQDIMYHVRVTENGFFRIEESRHV